MMSHFRSLALNSALLAFMQVTMTGCGNNLPQTVKVSGRVTFDGQPPPAAGSILFLPVEAAEGFPLRPASGAVGLDGQFAAQTFEPGDGLMPGKYLVSIECWDMPPSMQGNPGKSYVPKKYQSPQESGLSLDLTPQMRSQEASFDVVTK